MFGESVLMTEVRIIWSLTKWMNGSYPVSIEITYPNNLHSEHFQIAQMETNAVMCQVLKNDPFTRTGPWNYSLAKTSCIEA